MNHHIHRKELEHMMTKSVKITENSTSIRASNDHINQKIVPQTPLPIPRRELDEFLFHEGTARHAYTYLGAHAETDPDGKERVIIRC